MMKVYKRRRLYTLLGILGVAGVIFMAFQFLSAEVLSLHSRRDAANAVNGAEEMIINDIEQLRHDDIKSEEVECSPGMDCKQKPNKRYKYQGRPGVVPNLEKRLKEEDAHERLEHADKWHVKELAKKSVKDIVDSKQLVKYTVDPKQHVYSKHHVKDLIDSNQHMKDIVDANHNVEVHSKQKQNVKDIIDVKQNVKDTIDTKQNVKDTVDAKQHLQGLVNSESDKEKDRKDTLEDKPILPKINIPEDDLKHLPQGVAPSDYKYYLPDKDNMFTCRYTKVSSTSLAWFCQG